MKLDVLHAARGVAWRCLIGLGLMACLLTAMAVPSSEPALALRDQHSLLGPQLQHNAYQKPLVLLSTETAQGLRGDIYARMSYPFALVSSSLKAPGQWCEVMILHINTKYCHAAVGPSGIVLNVNIGRKTPQNLAQATRVSFDFQVSSDSPDYFEILLDAKDGPLGTSDVRLRMEAVSLPDNNTFLHLSYAYTTHLAGRLAMQTYLATLGAGKVGFTLVDPPGHGQPELIDGARGLVERNTMRYYLAINSYLQATRSAPSTQLEERLQSWFDAVEQYPRQLHEVERADYLAMKRAEHARQQTAR